MTGIFWIALLAGLFAFALSHLMGDFGHADVGGGHDHGGGGDSEGSPFVANLLTIRNLFLFVLGFGAAGAIAESLGGNDRVSTLAAVSGGVVLALAGAWFFGQLREQQANSLVNVSDLAGNRATVTTPIPTNGRGEIETLNTQGVRTTLPARSESGPIASQTIVTIVSVTGDTATVEPVPA